MLIAILPAKYGRDVRLLHFDLITFSGGKMMRGPQSEGILMGKKDLIAATRLSAPPRGGNIGRGMKVNKEEILGMYAALDKYVNQDHDAECKMTVLSLPYSH